MQLQEIPLDQLEAHPANSNVMPEPLFKKLVEHLRREALYPPIIVRALAADRYQLIDGHHRVKALRELQHTHARCVVWDVDEQGTLVLLATLNRLQGHDDPRKRAAVLAQLSQSLDVKELAKRLPEDGDKLKALLQLNDTPLPPRPPRDPQEVPVAIHFFVLPAVRRAIEHKLQSTGLPREEALTQLLGL